jgi:maltose-binding protein MalE
MVHQDIKKQMDKQKCMTYILSFYFSYLWTYAFGGQIHYEDKWEWGSVKWHRAVRQVPQE